MSKTSSLRTDEPTQSRMRAVRTHSTGAELAVRRLLHKAGYRFRLHRKDLPGRPDIVLPKHRTAVLVHGCFWHGHESCKKGLLRPVRNAEYWEGKIAGNVGRDRKVEAALVQLGWHVVVVWECELTRPGELVERLRREVGGQ